MSRRLRRAVRRSPAWYDSPWRIAGHAVSAALTVVVLAAVVALLVVPRVTGGTSLTVLTGSMEPTLRPGDVVVTRGIDVDQVCSEVGIGTIVTYLPKPDDPALITHRVVGKTVGTFEDGTSCRLFTQGDNNSAVDDPVSPAQVRGVFLYGLPKLGWARQWVGDNTQAVLVVAAVALVAYGLWSATRRPRTRVLALPGTAPAGGPAPTGPVGAPPPPDPGPWPADPWSVGPASAAREQELRERELAVRERELELREQALALRTDPDPSHPVTSEA